MIQHVDTIEEVFISNPEMFEEVGTFNGFIITWIFHQIIIYSNTTLPPSTSFTLPPLDEGTDQN